MAIVSLILISCFGTRQNVLGTDFPLHHHYVISLLFYRTSMLVKLTLTKFESGRPRLKLYLLFFLLFLPFSCLLASSPPLLSLSLMHYALQFPLFRCILFAAFICIVLFLFIFSTMITSFKTFLNLLLFHLTQMLHIHLSDCHNPLSTHTCITMLI